MAGARFGSAEVLLTPSCTTSLEMAALLLDIQPGDEVIVPSYTPCPHGLCLCVAWRKNRCGCRQDTVNIDETLIEAAITDKRAFSCRSLRGCGLRNGHRYGVGEKA
ncbi:DegT/DnrJ/EryC1/StrS family aminotransferase [Shigella flexneri]